MKQGEVSFIPSFQFLRLKHKEIKNYTAKAELKSENEQFIYTVEYKDIDRSIRIWFEKEFPYKILKWEEHENNSIMEIPDYLVSKGTLKESLLLDYWNKNGVKDEYLRENLGLSITY